MSCGISDAVALGAAVGEQVQVGRLWHRRHISHCDVNSAVADDPRGGSQFRRGVGKAIARAATVGECLDGGRLGDRRGIGRGDIGCTVARSRSCWAVLVKCCISPGITRLKFG